LALALGGCRQAAPPVPAPPPASAPAQPVAEAPAPAETVPADPPHAGLPNFHTVADGIYRGGAPTPEGFKSLRAMKIKTDIDLRIEAAHKQEKLAAEALGFKYLSLPMGKEAPTPQQVQTLLDTLADPEARPVYVHCQHGADRTGCMIGIYRVKVQGWSFEKAWAEMLADGFKPKLTELKEAVKKAAAG
jgi:protein tyrosine/serine phosphatase